MQLRQMTHYEFTNTMHTYTRSSSDDDTTTTE